MSLRSWIRIDEGFEVGTQIGDGFLVWVVGDAAVIVFGICSRKSESHGY